jgi:hypothetical protein
MESIFIIVQNQSDIKPLLSNALPQEALNRLRWINAPDEYSVLSIAATLLVRRRRSLVAIVEDAVDTQRHEQIAEPIALTTDILARFADPSQFLVVGQRALAGAAWDRPADSKTLTELTRFIKSAAESSVRSDTKTRRLEQQFTEKLLQLYYRCGRETGYWPNFFLRRVRNEGGLAAAKHWLNQAGVSRGFRRLAEFDRLDLSVEALALRHPWRLLFNDIELQTARERLREFKYNVP